MDNLESLFNKKEYESVVNLVGDSKDPKERLLALSSLVILGRTDEALDQIEKYQSILEKKYLLQLMKLHFELLLSKKLYDESRIALKHYEQIPYESQQVEEFLREIPARISDEEHGNKNKNLLPLDEVLDVLENETDSGKLSSVLFNLKDYNINVYIDSLKIMLTNPKVHPNLRTYALILLVDNKWNEKVSIISNDKIREVIPSKLNPPFMSNSFNDVCRLIVEKADKNVTLIETSLHLFNCYILDLYPDDVYSQTSEMISGAILVIAKRYIKEELSSIDEQYIELADQIQKILERTPLLSL